MLSLQSPTPAQIILLPSPLLHSILPVNLSPFPNNVPPGFSLLSLHCSISCGFSYFLPSQQLVSVPSISSSPTCHPEQTRYKLGPARVYPLSAQFLSQSPNKECARFNKSIIQINLSYMICLIYKIEAFNILYALFIE